ncbi:hypothetical protein ROZALSC1DRAFT_31440, partial [Rozella allomycis CSF55]
MGASFKKAIQSREHRERSQPSARQRLGFLEKHKDYIKRARDFQAKQSQLKVLREKALFRNPDEFYFKMINAKTKKGVHELTNHRNYSQDVIKLLKSQDIKYIHMHKTVNEKV